MNRVCQNQDERKPRGMTVVELVVAMALMVVVMGAVLPLLAGVRNGSDTQRAQSDMIQNGRVLNEHLLRHLGQAVCVVQVSAASETNGYIEFEDVDGVTNRYAVGAGDYVQFGPAGDPADLAGPVSSLQFVCYDANDLAHSTQEPAAIRLVTWEATLRSAGRQTRDRTVSGACYLRANGNALWESVTTTYDFATRQQGVEAAAFSDEGKPQVPLDPDTPAQELGTGAYDALELEDGDSHSVNASLNSYYGRMRYVFIIDEDETRVTQIAATWKGRGINEHQARIDGASLYLWNYATASYELLIASPSTELEVTLNGSRDSALTNYIGGAGENTIVLLAVSNDKTTAHKANRLSADYVTLDVIALDGEDLLLP
ncbi:MAG: prepilin-type N-terminal cleavage/methylation domain-containing protein [Sedimentisphaerales bacterium]|nr:prepilin-type N-terminal cleavage/methylation domain-containing protein [Sedimentisphaerales bacterium]